MGSFFKFRLTLTHVLTLPNPSTTHTHSHARVYTAHSSDQNSSSTGPESYTAFTTLKTMLSLSTDVVLAKWSVPNHLHHLRTVKLEGKSKVLLSS